MQKIKLITDSASDIPKEWEEKGQIHILKFHIAVDGKDYLEREDFSEVQFYQMLKRAKELPKTSKVTQNEFLQAFSQFYEQGYTDLIYVSINAKGSSTYDSAVLAKKIFYEEHPQVKEETFRIHIINSGSYTMAYGYPVIEAAKKAQDGADIKEVLHYLEEWLSYVRIYFAPYTLQYAKKSGRVSATKAFLGEMMGLKPIITFEGGMSKIVGKVRGESGVIPDLIARAKNEMVPKTPYLLLGGDNEAHTAELLKYAQKALGYPPEGVYKIGASIAINSGPDVSAVIFKERIKS